jgi:hypothetical protein
MSLGKRFSSLFTGKNNSPKKDNKPAPHAESTQHSTNSRIGELVNEPGKANPRTQSQEPVMTNKKGSLTLDVLDLTRVIDIYAESQAVQAFDAEMGKERK